MEDGQNSDQQSVKSKKSERANKKGPDGRGDLTKYSRPKRRQNAPLPQVRPTARKAHVQRRHIVLAFSFMLIVLLPIAVSAWYLWTRAADQYASYLGFSVRSETGSTSSEVLGGITSLVGMTNSSSSDTDILYKFIQSHDLVARVDARLDLREIWSKAPDDPVFSYTGNTSLEDLLSEWDRKVRVYYDNGMIDLRVLAFDAQDAHAIAQAIYDESTILINQLNDVAREDALRYARIELEDALERLKEARQEVTTFRNRHQMVDPSADVQSQAGVVSSLQQQLAEALVQLGLLQANAQPSDPRIEQSELRIRVIREQIEAERQKFSSETATGEALSDVVGQYESLAVDRDFAESTYTAALAAYDSARAEATRQSRYLAAYVKPTLAQEAEYPERARLMMILSGFLLVIWIIGVLIFYSLRDRR
ncbi:sugar transporter [Paracoccus saliphilus]|uniref:Capsular polysaccharide transport system permease protein n=1 Tax=Paracoccus saliphilus TaxID=405559 RepID=A0AA45W8N9_9RHOB|nr:sugar transporter [Paracoccus saliphilus]WCR05490.1 sugar transporter [Paracoccus saliphilus]SIT18237.1 capsular polysaccharide transport system permease protein [Paracoccus saliphilus]